MPMSIVTRAPNELPQVSNFINTVNEKVFDGKIFASSMVLLHVHTFSPPAHYIMK